MIQASKKWVSKGLLEGIIKPPTTSDNSHAQKLMTAA